MIKTNVMRLLDAGDIPYTPLGYGADESDLSASHAAEQLGLEPERVFKTLVLRGAAGSRFVCCIPAPDEVDLKKAARAAGEKSAELIPVKELFPLTGYMRGGCSPLGMKKRFPVYVDETALLFETVSVSAGARGLIVLLRPGDLLALTAGRTADLTTG